VDPRAGIEHAATAVDRCGTTNTALLLVHLKMTIKAVRHGPRDYTFSATFLARQPQRRPADHAVLHGS
jgi:hypothetical protein